jgi:cytochrome c2
MASIALVFWREYGSEWRKIQKDYRNLKKQYSPESSSSSWKIRIQQIYLPEMKRVDRCITCHLSVEEEEFQNAPQPLKTHSEEILKDHPPDSYGCTICHGGQGYGLSFESTAHQELKYWDDPLIPLELVESRCGICHKGKDVPLAPMISEGRELIDNYNCMACHDISGFEENKFFGPSWNEVGAKVTKEWLEKWIKDPHSYLEKPRMPKFSLAEEERIPIVEYLLHLHDGRTIEELALEEGEPESGGALFRESRCITCHSVEGKGGSIGPDLGKVADKVSARWLFNFLKDPHYYQPETPMPKFGFNEQEIINIISYMFEEFVEEGAAEESEFRTLEEDFQKRGEQLFKKYGCLSCHQLSGYESGGKIGPDLTKIGSKDLDILNFGDQQNLKKSLPNWIFMKLKDPRFYDQEAKMPYYEFSDEEAAKITLALLSLIEEEIPPSKVMESTHEDSFLPHGKVGEIFKKYRCLSCHEIGGYGGTISHAPLDREGDQVQKSWLKKYLRRPYAIKVAYAERMPKLKMTDDEIKLLADYMELVFVDDSIPKNFEKSFMIGDVEKGKNVFDDKGCISCHILGDNGGYVGPQLNGTGRRLKAGWIYEFLMNPLKYQPETVHPDYNLTEDEARELTAFLWSLKETEWQK